MSDPAAPIHLVKLCVGAAGVDDLRRWQAGRAAAGQVLRHVTRMRPKRSEEILQGGSLYWVFQGRILARQRILGLEEVESDGRPACGILLDSAIVETIPVPRRPFQGWRYLEAGDAPADLERAALRAGEAGEEAPAELLAALAEVGVA